MPNKDDINNVADARLPKEEYMNRRQPSIQPETMWN
jgi:hypothetical protein